MCVYGVGGSQDRGPRSGEAARGAHRKMWNGPACSFPALLAPVFPAALDLSILRIPGPRARPSAAAAGATEYKHASHNSPWCVFPSSSRWPVWGRPRPLGAGRCRFLMSCAHMDTQTSGAAMCGSGQARPGEPIRGPWAPGRGLGGVCARPTSERR